MDTQCYRLELNDEPKRIKPGPYRAEIVNVSEEISESNEPYLRWKLKICESEDCNRRIFYYNTILEGEYNFYLKNFLYAADANFDLEKFNPKNFIGKHINVELAEKRYCDGSISIWPKVVKVKSAEKN